MALSAGQTQRSQAQLSLPDAGRFRDWDRNNDGIISRSEWRGTAQEFQDLDWNRDGILSGDEVRISGDSESSQFDDWTEPTFNRLDRNRDHLVSRAEWLYDPATFTRIDRNRDNVISRSEFLGADNDAERTYYDPEQSDRFADLDTNNDQRIEFHEWPGSYAEFQRLDTNHDGVIGRREYGMYSDAARTRYERDEFLDLDRNGDRVLSRNEWHGSRATFRQHDLNGDGLITRSEYLRAEGVQTGTMRRDDVASRMVTVDARQPWTSTGIYLQAGDVITFSAEGTIQMSTNSSDLASPTGSNTGRNARNSPRPDRPAGGLLMRVGNGPVDYIGASGTLTVNSPGELFLGVNDDYLKDNVGTFRVMLRLER